MYHHFKKVLVGTQASGGENHFKNSHPMNIFKDKNSNGFDGKSDGFDERGFLF